MNFPNKFSIHRWLIVPFCAVLFVVVSDVSRIWHLERVSAIGRERGVGESEHRHWLVVPEQNSRAYQWLGETEQMLATGEWRLRHVSHENAPEGRTVHTASVQRWWLGFVTWFVEKVSRCGRATALDRAALFSGPAMHLLLLAGSTWFVAWRFSSRSAAVVSAGLAILFPLGGEFLPGVPDDRSLILVCAWWTVLLLLDGLLHGRRMSFALSGVAGGLGLWVGVSVQVPVLGAIAAGALVVALWERKQRIASPVTPRHWMSWATAGAGTSGLAYLAEYLPGDWAFRLQVNHPLYGIAWIGAGLLLFVADPRSSRKTMGASHSILMLVTGVAATATLPVVMLLSGDPGFLVANPQSSRLTNLPDGAVASSFADWFARDGATLAILATALPLVLLVSAVRALLRRDRDRSTQAATAVSGVLVLLCLLISFAQLQWWAMTQLALLALVVVLPVPRRVAVWFGVVVLCALPGFIQLVSTVRLREDAPLARLEIDGLVARDIAHWISDHADEDGAVVLAAPERSPALWYHGGIRGLGSPNWENRDGVAAAVNILSATTSDEAQALLEQRGVTHIVLFSWDSELDEFVRWTKYNPADTFLGAIRRWALPPWLQPQPYVLPDLPGLVGQSVVVLKITGDTDRALALSRLADYALELQDAPLAAAANDALQEFPASLPALIGRAQVEKSRANTQALEPVLASIQQSLANGLDRMLTWDRRVSLAVVLAKAGRKDLAQPQVQQCIAELDDGRVRSLGAGALYRLLVLSKAFDAPVNDPALLERALALLPSEARARL